MVSAIGGVGKTTIAAALLCDSDVRATYQRLLWVSVGQDPDIRELQDSIHQQLLGERIPNHATTPDLVIKALRDAAKGLRVLLVLDDVWQAPHEKPLNIISSDNASRILVTSRIRGLLGNANEVDVGVLSEDAALELLISSADMIGEELTSDGRRVAMEIVEFCGRLPLTVSICGGIVKECQAGFSEDVLDSLKDNRGIEDEDGVALEERIISSSIQMMSKNSKHQELAGEIFKFFAVFPE